MRVLRRMRRVSASSLGSTAIAASHSSFFDLRPGRPRAALALRPSASLASSCSSAALALLMVGFLAFSSALACALAGIWGFACLAASAFFLAAGAALAAARAFGAGRALARATDDFFFNGLICLAFFPGLRDFAA